MIPNPLRVASLLAVCLCCALGGARAQQEGEPEPQLPPEVVALRERAQGLWDKAMASYEKASEAKNERVAEQHRRDVVSLFDEIVKLGKDSGKYGIAQFNAALVSRSAGPPGDDGALTRFHALVASDVDDRDPTGELMRPFRNYRHYAFRQIMSIHRGRGAGFLALDALFRSRTAFVTHCATCAANMQAGFEQELDGLCLELVHGDARDELDEPAVAADAALVDAALEGAADARAFTAAFAERLERAGRAEHAAAMRKLLPPAGGEQPSPESKGPESKGPKSKGPKSKGPESKGPKSKGDEKRGR